jgi:hypothetical protein
MRKARSHVGYNSPPGFLAMRLAWVKSMQGYGFAFFLAMANLAFENVRETIPYDRFVYLAAVSQLNGRSSESDI